VPINHASACALDTTDLISNHRPAAASPTTRNRSWPVRRGKSINAVARTFNVHLATIYHVLDGEPPSVAFLFPQLSSTRLYPAGRLDWL
jgi:hypothetical protein